MKILVYGTDTFDDYSTFMRGLVVAIDENGNILKKRNKSWGHTEVKWHY